MKYRIYHSVIVCLLFITVLATARISDSEIDDVLRKALECRNIPGMAVSIVQDNKILFAGGYGYETVEKRVPVTTNTLFGIAALSKSFASIILLKVLRERST